jgi:AcrR family transcriptional regulator
MRYTKEHKVRTRGRIVERASLALREEGADGVSVAALMDLAGLTHGGFYAHFESREALVVEAVLMAMDQTMSRWLQLIETTPVADRFNAIVDTYINAQDRDNRGRGCPLPALGADIARSSEKARRAFAQKLQEMIDGDASPTSEPFGETCPPDRDGRNRDDDGNYRAFAGVGRKRTIRLHSQGGAPGRTSSIGGSNIARRENECGQPRW